MPALNPVPNACKREIPLESAPTYQTFADAQMDHVNEAVILAEELTSNHFKYSSSQWRRSRYDIRTLKDLQGPEITDTAFAQILRYVGQPTGTDLGSYRFDFYKICLQDHVILHALDRESKLALYPLVVYVVTHELVHIVRFSGFHQMFETYPSERAAEETRVHEATAQILEPTNISGLAPIAQAYRESQKILGFAVDKVSQVN